MFFQPPVPSYNIVTSVPAPVGGLNAKDSLVAMPSSDAIVLNNWWPQPYGCSVRKGYTQWASGFGTTVRTIQEWSNITGSSKLFAWDDYGMYDITIAGAIGAPLVTGFTASTVWSCAQVTNAAGNNLIAVNGADDGIIYKASGVARLVLGDGIVANTWAGLNPRNATQLTVHQHRLWAVQKNTASAWFLPPDAIQGTFKEYDFGPLFSRGGYLVFLATWTMDDNSGADDYLVGLSSNGEAVVYSGTDPEDPNAWQLLGVFYIGAPVSSKVAFCKASGDLLVLTQQGVVSMSAQIAARDASQAETMLTSSKIQYLVSQAITASSGYAGWDIKYFPADNMLLVNVPTLVSTRAYQLVVNQLIGAWAIFSGLPASCWGSFGTKSFFGTASGTVLQNWVGNTDNAAVNGTGGTSITAEAQQAYTYFEKHAIQKQVSMYRPNFVLNKPIGMASKIEYDFKSTLMVAPNAAAVPDSGVWDLSSWDIGKWGGGSFVQGSWVQAQGIGQAASLRLTTQSDGEVLWISTDYSLISGEGIF